MNASENWPEWMDFIGKWGDQTVGHPLVYHLIDSASVASLLWQQALTRGSKEQFSQWLNLPAEDCCRLLTFWTSLHDLGKAAPSFQCKHEPSIVLLESRGFSFSIQKNNSIVRHHSLLSQWILQDFQTELNIQPAGIFNQFRFAIGGHHGSFHYLQDDEIKQEKDVGPLNLGNEHWRAARRGLFTALKELYNPPDVPFLKLSRTGRNAFFNLLTGFFVAADWISSQDDLFQYYPEKLPLEEYQQISQCRALSALQQTGWTGWQPDDRQPGFNDLFGFAPYPLQQAILDEVKDLREPFALIIEAPTGCGKTEAALTAADRAVQACGLRGFYIAMPTQATSNQMYGRTLNFLSRRFPTQNVNLQLAHGSALLNEDFKVTRIAAVEDEDRENSRREGSINAMEWFLPRKRTLLAPFGVGTVDQAFMGVLRARHSFLRLFGLHRKVVIFDEVHAYDTYMQEIFIQLLAWLRAVGSPVIILSATLPDPTRQDLLEAYQRDARVESRQAAYPRMSLNTGSLITTRSLGKFEDRTVSLEKISYDPQAWIEPLREKLAQGGCAAVICNTVDRAQEVFSVLRKAKIVDEKDVILLHARMPYCWRKAKEDEILKRFGKLKEKQAAPRRGIVVATQVIEQSLDLDFDLLITDLAPIDLLIQRIGRLQRHEGSMFPPFRPAELADPHCWVCQPDAPETNELPAFGKDLGVYDPVILQRTFFALSTFSSLSLPSVSDELINTVYSSQPLSLCSPEQNDKMNENFLKMDRKQEEEIGAARKCLVGDVDKSDVVGGRIDYLKEDSSALEEQTRALTRNAVLPSVQLVCLEQVDGKTVFLDGHFPVSLSETPHGEGLKCALRSLVNVSKSGVVHYFWKQPRHQPWAEQPSLRRAYPVVFERGICTLDNGIRLVLDPALGLKIED